MLDPQQRLSEERFLSSFRQPINGKRRNDTNSGGARQNGFKNSLADDPPLVFSATSGMHFQPGMYETKGKLP